VPPLARNCTALQWDGDADHAGRITVRSVDHTSLVIVLSTGGSPLDRVALEALGDVAVAWVRVEREGDAACLAARLRHVEPPEDFRERIRHWAAARGWAATVAPSGPPR
jgi:hypothetical protein